MHSLTLHPSCQPGAIRTITAAIAPTSGGCEAEFRIAGRIADICIPRPANSRRTDDLWRTTCLEIFWQPVGAAAYTEFNLSPSGQWAGYRFDAARENMRDAAVGAIAISCSHDTDTLVLRAAIAADLPDPARVALTAIIEQTDGAVQYWAPDFGAGKPDFHAEDCRTINAERDRSGHW